MRRFVTVLLCALTLAACRTAGDRPPGPGDAPPAGPGPVTTGGATPSPTRDGMGATGNNPAQQREYAGTPGTASAKPAPAESGGRCSEDADCALSRYLPGQCCQDCQERPVLRSELEAQNERCAEELGKCPMRNCAPGQMGRTVACVEGRCVVRPAAR